MTAACQAHQRQLKESQVVTYHKARTRADHEHRAGAVQPALLVEALVERTGALIRTTYPDA